MLYVEPPKFVQSFHNFYNEHIYHILIQSLRECFSTAVDIEAYIIEQDQALAHMKDDMSTIWARQNQNFEDNMHDMYKYLNSDNIWFRSFSFILFPLLHIDLRKSSS